MTYRAQLRVNSNPRQLKLLDVVRARGSVTVEQLAETLEVTLQTVRRDVQRLAEAGLQADVQGRPKHLHSIWKKMRGKGLDFERVLDVRALRVVVVFMAASSLGCSVAV